MRVKILERDFEIQVTIKESIENTWVLFGSQRRLTLISSLGDKIGLPTALK